MAKGLRVKDAQGRVVYDSNLDHILNIYEVRTVLLSSWVDRGTSYQPDYAYSWPGLDPEKHICGHKIFQVEKNILRYVPMPVAWSVAWRKLDYIKNSGVVSDVITIFRW